jgi:hypothetical protein
MADQPNIHFVISAPRSGSTWLTTALNHHPEIFATEHRFFGDFCEVWKNNNGTTMPRITFDKYARAFGQHYFHEAMDLEKTEFVDALQRSFLHFIVGFAVRRTGKSIVIDKVTPYPGTSDLVVKKIRSMVPGARIIQLVRDGRDVLTSGTYDWILKDAVGTPRHQFVVEKKLATLDRFFDDAVIEKWAENWKETLLPFDSTPADVRVTYEGMKQDLAATLADIFEAVGAHADNSAAGNAEKATRFEKMTGREAGDAESPTAKARKGVAGDWKRHFTIRDGRIFHRIAGEQLLKYGYESDPYWFKTLPESLQWQQ